MPPRLRMYLASTRACALTQAAVSASERCFGTGAVGTPRSAKRLTSASIASGAGGRWTR